MSESPTLADRAFEVPNVSERGFSDGRDDVSWFSHQLLRVSNEFSLAKVKPIIANESPVASSAHEKVNRQA